MATTTPFDLVTPLAELLELDDVIATRYGLDAAGRYDGTIDGEFVWGPGKLAAVRAWAEAHGIQLRDSLRLLRQLLRRPPAVRGRPPDRGQPRPAPRRRGRRAALAGAPPRRAARACRSWRGLEPQQVLQAFARPELFPFARFDIEGVEHIPSTGGGLVCGNHRSYFDPLVMGMTLSKKGRPVRFLGKKEVFDAPVVGTLAKAMGGIRVDRGTGSDEPLEAAADALAAGQLVALMPQGTIPRGPAFFDPELKGRWGAARLAAQTRVPVIPVGLWGTEKVWPRNARFPDVLNVTDAAGDHGAGRAGRRADLRGPRRRHQGDHGRHRRPAPGRGPHLPRADRARSWPARTRRAGPATREAETERRPGTD